MRIKKEIVLLGIATAWLFVGCDGYHWDMGWSELDHRRGLLLLMGLFVSYVAIQALTLKYQPHAFIVIALIYQPFLKLHLKSLWDIVDIITGIYMVWVIIRISFSEFFESVVFPKLRKRRIHLLVIWSIWLLILIGNHMDNYYPLHFYFWEWLLKIPTLITLGALLICIDELQPKK